MRLVGMRVNPLPPSQHTPGPLPGACDAPTGAGDSRETRASRLCQFPTGESATPAIFVDMIDDELDGALFVQVRPQSDQAFCLDFDRDRCRVERLRKLLIRHVV